LLNVLHRLVDDGNTVLVIEHNLDIIKTADYIVDMGPDGGKGGGMIIAEGTLEKITTKYQNKSDTASYLLEEINRNINMNKN